MSAQISVLWKWIFLWPVAYTLIPLLISIENSFLPVRFCNGSSKKLEVSKNEIVGLDVPEKDKHGCKGSLEQQIVG